MTSIKYIILAFMLTTCDPAVSYISSNGVSYYFENVPTWNLSQIEAQEAGLLSHLPSEFDGYMDEIKNSLKYVKVTVAKDPQPCVYADASTTCNGLQMDQYIYVVWFECPGESTLSHELAHWIRQVVFLDFDPNHLDKPLWIIADTNYSC